MMVNNEVGTIQPIKELAAIAKAHDVLFHTDTVQAIGNVPIDVKELGVDFISMSAHKIYGPKGVGILYLGPRASGIRSLIHGGSQERNKRAGTENIPAIVGFGKACEIAKETLSERMQRERELRDYMKQKVLATIPHTTWHGSDGEDRLPGNLNFGFRFVEAESVLILLDQRGIAASSGSACTAGSIDPSHVLIAIGADEDEGRESIRLTLSDETTK
jgi:cysteine desulfurase